MGRYRSVVCLAALWILVGASILASPHVPESRATGSNDDPDGGLWMEQDGIGTGDVDKDGETGDPSDDDPVDWWRFNGTEGITYDIELWINEYYYDQPDISLGLYGPDSGTTHMATTGTDIFSDSYEFGLALEETLSSSGVYYIKVESNDNRNIPYMLHWDSNEVIKELEFDTPRSEYLDYHLDDYDYFFFNVTGPRAVRLTMDMEKTTTDFDLYLYDSTSKLLDESSQSQGLDEQIEYTLPSQGMYFVSCEVWENLADNWGNYTLLLEDISSSVYSDLTVTSITPGSAVVNNSYTYTVTIKNIGGADASDMDVNVSVDTVHKATLNIPGPLSPQQSDSVQISHTFSTPGPHTVGAHVDPWDNITEGSEANNMYSQQVDVSGPGSEEDDDPDGANALPLNTSETDSVDESTDEVDWWKFTLPKHGIVDITLSWSGGSDLDLYLYDDPQSYSIASSALSANPEAIEGYMDAAGEYYIKVRAPSSAAPQAYELALDFIPGEDNDVAAGAGAISINTTVQDQVNSSSDPADWHKVNAPSAGLLNITLSWEGSANLNLYLYEASDPDSYVEHSSQYSGNQEHILYVLNSGGWYYVKVPASSGTADYDLYVEFTTQLTDDFPEGANHMAINTSEDGSVHKTTDIEDWWYVDIPASGNLEITLNCPAGDIDIYLYADPTGSAMGSSVTPSDPEIITEYVTSGTYYIMVRAYTSGTTLAYTLEVIFSTGFNDDEPEGAPPAALNSTVNGSVSSSGDQVDYWKVNVTGQGTLDLVLSWPGTGDLDLYLYDDPDSYSAVKSSAGTTNPESISHMAPSAGMYYVKVKAYGGTENYQLQVSFAPYIPGQGPDLVVSSVSPTTATVNTPFSFSVIINNQGTGDASTSFDLSVYYDGSSWADGTNTQPSLSAQTQTTVSFSTTFYSTGTHTIKAVVDDDNDVFEDDETNNEMTVNVQVQDPGANEPPTAVVASPTEGASFTTNDQVPFDATGSSDPDGDTLSYMWKSSIDGILGSSKQLQKKLTRGNHTITLSVDDGNGGSDGTMVNITVTLAGPNQNPSITLVEPDGTNDVADTDYFIKWNWADPDGQDCTVDLYYDFDTDPAVKADIVMGLDAAKGQFKWDLSKLKNGDYYVYAMIKDGEGGSGEAYSPGMVTVKHNTNPLVSVMEPDGNNDNADKSFTITWTATDQEQEDENLDISIYYIRPLIPDTKNLIESGLENTGSYQWNTTLIANGDYIIFITVDDGKGGTSQGYSKGSVSVLHNAAPTTPENLKPTETHDLRPRFSWHDSQDSDVDDVLYRVSMWKGTDSEGQLIIDDITTFPTSMMVPLALSYGPEGLSQEYYVEITAEDSKGATSPPLTEVITVFNNPPTTPEIKFAPSTPLSIDDLKCVVSTPSNDPDGDTPRYKFQWFRNDDELTLDQGNDFSVKEESIVHSSFLRKEDEVYCKVTPWDGYAEGDPATLEVTIANTPPYAVITYPSDGEVLTSTTLSLDAGDSSDEDNDELTYAWYVDGEKVGTGITLDTEVESGEHEIKLMVSDGSDTEEDVITIHIKTSLVIVESVFVRAEDIKEKDNVEMVAVVKNIGDAAANQATVVFMDGESEIGRRTVSDLEPGATRDISTNWVALEGDHEIYAYIMGNPTDSEGRPEGWKSTAVGVEKTKTPSSKSSDEGFNMLYIYLVIVVIIVAVIAGLSLYAYTKHLQREKERREKEKLKKIVDRQNALAKSSKPPKQPLSGHPYSQAYYNYLEPRHDPYSRQAGYYMNYPTERPYLEGDEKEALPSTKQEEEEEKMSDHFQMPEEEWDLDKARENEDRDLKLPGEEDDEEELKEIFKE